MLLIPNQNPYVSGETAVFDSLVRTGEERSHVTLPFNLRLFLVDCLIEHLPDAGITQHVLALGLLESSEKSGAERTLLLKRTGDAALILAGLYPERANRLNVTPTYFRFMGQTSYATLATHLLASSAADRGKFFNEVADGFVLLERVLNNVRAEVESEWIAFLWFRTKAIG